MSRPKTEEDHNDNGHMACCHLLFGGAYSILQVTLHAQLRYQRSLVVGSQAKLTLRLPYLSLLMSNVNGDVPEGVGNEEQPPDTETDPAPGAAAAISSSHAVEESEGPTNEPDIAVVTDVVFLEEHHHGVMPSAGEALAIDTTEEAVDTIRLDSTNILSIRHLDRRDRPEYLSVILCSLTGFHTVHFEDQAVLGISLGVAEDEQLIVTHITEESPFLASAVVVGDSLLSLNDTNCKSMTPDSALALLLSLVTSGSDRGTIIRFHNKGGNAQRVATTVEKPFPEVKLGLKLAVNSRGAVIIASLSPDQVLASSLLNISDRVISVNEHDCTPVATSATPVSEWITQAPRYVTIVVETLTTTGVVVATGSSAPWASPLHLGGTTTASAPSPASRVGGGGVANSLPTDMMRQHRIKAIVFGFSIFVITILAVALAPSNNNNNDAFKFTPSPTPFPPSSPSSDSCSRALLLEVNGPSLRGTNVEADFGPPVASCVDVSDELHDAFGPNVWYTFVAPDDVPVVVSICDDSASVDTFLTLYVGSCNFGLACIDSNDDSDCGLASRIRTTPRAGVQYYIQLHGFDGQVGSFDIKVESNPFSSVECECN
jgi:hypothetical protein